MTVGRCISRVKRDKDHDLKSRFEGLMNIGIDETSYKKGHSCETIKLFFEALSKEQRSSIETVTGDGPDGLTKP